MKVTRLIGIVLIAAGVILAVWLVAGQYAHTIRQWNELPYKADEFQSVTEYFWSISKGAVLIAAAIFFSTAAAGIALIRK